MATYNDLVNASRVVLIEFYATWCVHCQRMMPVVAQLRELTDGMAEIYQLDIDRDGEAAEAEGVNSTPTFILYRDGERVWSHAGEIDGNVLLEKIQQFAG